MYRSALAQQSIGTDTETLREDLEKLELINTAVIEGAAAVVEKKLGILTDAGELLAMRRSSSKLSLKTHVLMATRSSVGRMHEEIGRLTPTQRECCKRCYATVENDPVKFGLNIMIRLFSNHPHYKDIWPQFREIPDSSLFDAPQLRSHARVYMGGLRTVIHSMDDDTKLEKSLRNMAKAHVKWNIQKRHLINMLPGVLKSFEEHCEMNLEACEAWSTLFDVIANLIDIFRKQ